MAEHAPLPWTTSDLASGVVDDLGNGIIICNNANAAFIVKAVNNHEALVEALKLARARIEYLGEVCTNPKHFQANFDEFLPRIDAALGGAVGGVGK